MSGISSPDEFRVISVTIHIHVLFHQCIAYHPYMGQTYPHQSSVLNLRDRSHICYFHSNGRQRGLPNDKQAFHGLWGSSGFKCSVMPSVGVRLVGTKPHKMWLSPPPHHERDWSRIRWWIVRNFQIVIVSAVKICKQCLQADSASEAGGSGLCPWTPLGDFRPEDSRGYSPKN